MKGGPEPAIETYLADRPETERIVLRAELEKVQENYRRQLRSRRRSGNDTVGYTPAAMTDTPEPPLAGTVELRAETPTGPAATMAAEELGIAAVDLGVELNTQVDPPERQTGTSLERPAVTGYEILGELGRGGMGVVYKARHIKLDRVVALKMVLAGAHAGKDQLARFYTEAQAVAHLHHHNIIQIYEVGEQSGLPYFSLEFVDGGSLSEKTAGKPQPPKEAVDMVWRLAEAMSYAHQHGIVHRDLKPMNVLLMRDGTPKITDFGLAKRLEGESSSQTRSGAILGTPSYMAPEQALGEVHDVGPLTDVYALGAMLYELLTGRPPFLAATPMDTVIQVIRDEPVPPSQLQPGLPRDAETICLKCLQKEQLKRYASAGELAEDLQRFLAGEPIKARPVSTPERLWRWCRRNPRVALLSAAVILLLVTAAVGSTAAAFVIHREKDAAVEARKLAEKNEYAAKVARDEADENAKVAAEQGSLAVDSLYKVVTKIQSRLSDKPALRPLRQELLDEAFEGLERVVNTSQSSSLVGRTKAAAHQSMGDISLYLGRLEQALEQFGRMHKLLEALADAEPDNPNAVRNLAVSFGKLGDVADRLGQTANALLHYERSLELRERYLSMEPDNPLAEQGLAETCGRLGRLLVLAGDPTRALPYCLRSLRLREAGCKREPENEIAAQELASVYSILGDVSIRLDNPALAREYSDKYVNTFEELAAAHPDNSMMRGNLLVAYVRSGDLLLQLRENEAARDYHAKAVQPLRDMLVEDAQNATVKRNLSVALYGLGTACLRLGDSTASDRFQECLNLRKELAARDQSDARAQTDLMLALPRCGEHAPAAEIAERLRERATQNPKNLYNIACCYALCSAAVDPDEATVRDRYAAFAFAALRDAIAHGYKALGQLRTDPDLDSIREQPEYLKVVEELKQATGQ
jgi:serine/threonine-protein kinase